ncbi:MAG TPA: hypothetical protein VFM49_19060 [Chloroflexia bacterium]|jgi:hypothetical protein|nr:hypothetical protein [Chloroflexia bacterium]
MSAARTIVDKGLGTTAITLALLGGLGSARSVQLLLHGSTLAHRIFGLAGIPLMGLSVPLAAYVGYRLVRYPPERRSSVTAIARDAKRQRRPLTTRWEV